MKKLKNKPKRPKNTVTKILIHNNNIFVSDFKRFTALYTRTIFDIKFDIVINEYRDLQSKNIYCFGNETIQNIEKLMKISSLELFDTPNLSTRIGLIEIDNLTVKSILFKPSWILSKGDTTKKINEIILTKKIGE